MLDILCDSVERGERPTMVYGLIDPAAPEVVRYVGRTCDPVGRYRGHYLNGSPWVREWMEEVVKAGRKPTMVLLERSEDRAREAYWIRHHQEAGHADLNGARPWPEDVAINGREV